jgi:hypothetical protein
MAIATLKLFLSAGVIAFTSWLAGRRPGLAGFILALPISSLLALAFTQVQFQDSEKKKASSSQKVSSRQFRFR